MPKSSHPVARRLVLAALALAATLAMPPAALAADVPSARAREIAAQIRAAEGDASIATLGELVTFRTVARDGLPNADNPEFKRLSAALRTKAEAFGLDFSDHGAVVVIGLGPQGAPKERLGLVVHADVQPVDASKWARDPFTLDATTEPGRLLARGAEDDKGSLATALHAMKGLAERKLPLARRIELIVSYSEESDWQPFQDFLASNPPPDLNIGFDAEYPVVVAEKGWCSVHLTLDPTAAPAGAASGAPHLERFTGGSFLSQVPEDAEAVIRPAPAALVDRLIAAARRDRDIRWSFEPLDDEALRLRARGVSAHSSTPWDGKNAIAHLATLLATERWPDGQAARMVRLLDDLVGLGIYAERFGAVAYAHPFMGKLTLALDTLGYDDRGRLTAGINLRRPEGRSKKAVEDSILEAVEGWTRRTRIPVALESAVYDPSYREGAPHVATLLAIFRNSTGRADARAISIGGGTHARLLPNGVNFGPGMPGEVYTGHTEHEFITRDQMLLNLEMVTAALVELAGARTSP